MRSLSINIESDGAQSYPVLEPQGWEGSTLLVPVPVDCSYLDGGQDRLPYADVQEQGEGEFLARQGWSRDGYAFEVSDRWHSVAPDRVRLERRLTVSTSEAESPTQTVEGFQLHLGLHLSSHTGGDWRFFAPGMLYSPSQHEGEQLVTFSDHRLTYPLIAGYQPTTGRAVCVCRVDLADFDNRPVRPNKEARYMQNTDIGSSGFSQQPEGVAFHLFWPYYEGQRSASLDANGTPASAFYPLRGDGRWTMDDGVRRLNVSLAYEMYAFEAESFADAVFGAFKAAYALAEPQPPRLPFSLPEAIEYRLESLAKTYHEWRQFGAAFVLNFDPERGYDSQAKAFGASFTTHGMGGSRDIIEFGFTGRQLNVAYVLAERYGGEWLERGRRVVNFFVDHMTTRSGWAYTLYHLGKKRPLYTCGDPDGPIMHYLAISPQPGNYTRTMVEAATDLLLNYQLHRQRDAEHESWLAACRRFADFLLAHQDPDGSWYRAYTPGGAPIHSSQWFGATEHEAKSATCIPVPFLLTLAEELGDAGQTYVDAAERACRYVLDRHVDADEYRGGTLDNPNVVDKEAALLTMAALLRMYERGGDPVYLAGAHRAAKLAVTWNSIWNVPPVPGTRLDAAGVRSTGWGGINSIWGAGVTDIYTLFFLAEFVRLSRLTGEPLYAQVAELVAHGTQQILSHPGDLMGFADTGMQPEGIAFCDQGVDDGLIAKGDIWGGLGWIYTAGTFGLGRYLTTPHPPTLSPTSGEGE